MKASKVFWGSLLIFLGIFFLLRNFGIMNIDLESIFDLWPLLLVVWGVSLLKVPYAAKVALSALSALLIALIIISSFTSHWNWGCSDNNFRHKKYISTSQMSLPNSPNFQYAVLDFNGGAGDFSINNTTNELVETWASGAESEITVDSTKVSGTAEVNMNFDLGDSFLHHFEDTHKAEVKLNVNPIWDLNIKVGAAKFESDLRPFKTKSIKISAGAADIEMKLGNLYDSTDVYIDVGASSVKINIPDSSGCRIYSKTGLSGEDFQGFTRQGDYWETENYNSSSKKIRIHMTGGVSSFDVYRYNIAEKDTDN